MSRLDDIRDNYGLHTSAGEWEAVKADIKALITEVIGDDIDSPERVGHGEPVVAVVVNINGFKAQLRRRVEAL